MVPPEKALRFQIFVAHVFLGADQHYFAQITDDLANRFYERVNAHIGSDSFAILHAGFQKFPRDPAIGVDTGNDEWSKKIALAAFIHAKVRLEHLRRMHFFVTKSCFAQNFWLELELHELLYALALHEDLWPLLVNGYAQSVLLRKKNRVRFRRKSETKLVEQGAQFFCLIGIERRCENVHVRIL